MRAVVILCAGLILMGSLVRADNCTDPSCLNCPDSPEVCTNCMQSYYLESDHTCKACTSKIFDCMACEMKKEDGDTEAELECSRCADEYTLSNDNKQCYLPKHETIIIITAVVAFVLLVAGGVTIYVCARKKRVMFKDGEYERVG